jgi:DNA-binding response OmpR family regulator
MKILIVEDEKELLESMAVYLEKENYLCEKAENFNAAQDKIVSFQYSVIILDINLPGGSGLDLIPLIKKENQDAGILIVSARNSLNDKLSGLDTGADDYITKPFHLAELNSRLRAIIRRRNFRGKEVLKFNEIEIFPESKEVHINGENPNLTGKEYELLLYFVTNKNRVLTKQSIAESLWGDFMDVADNFDFIYTHIRNLRKKIKDLKGTDYLSTVYGFGYKFTDNV